MSIITYTEIKCDRCGRTNKQEGGDSNNLHPETPKGWNTMTIGMSVGFTSYLLCPRCIAIMHKMGKRIRKVKTPLVGKDKKPQNKGKSLNLEASEVQPKEIIILDEFHEVDSPLSKDIAKKLAASVKKLKPEKVKVTFQKSPDPNVCEPGKPQFQKCPKCPERSKCTKDGGSALDCWDKRVRETPII